MGGLEKVAYDSKEKILYGVSEQGFVSTRCVCVHQEILLPYLIVSRYTADTS